MKANLHVHTNHSDGTKTVSEINELALKNNIDVIGITDHDTLNAAYDIVKLDTTVKFILGVEVSCKYKGETIHILGYFKDIPDKKLIDYFKINEEKRLNRCLKIIDNLEKYYGIKIDYEDVKKRADGLIARPHISAAICDKIGCTFDEAFDKYIGDDSKAYVPYDVISLSDAIKLLKENNALTVLAHPVLIKKFDYKEIINMGFDGIEVYHPNQSDEFSEELLKLAHENHLIITAGSDYHGEKIPNKFNESLLYGNYLDEFLKALNKLS